MQGDHIEITLHHHRLILLANRRGGPIQAKQMFALLKYLRLGGIEVFRFGGAEAAAAKANHTALPVVDRHHHPTAKAVIKPLAPLARHHQAGRLQQLRSKALHPLQMSEQTIPLIRGIAQLEGLQAGLAEAAVLLQIAKRLLAIGRAQLGTEPAGRQAEHPVKLLAAGELLAKPFLLRAIQGFNRQLIAPRQLQHHIAEILALQFHQELDRIAAGTAGKAVIKLFGWRHRHRRRAVVVEGANANKFPPLLLEHHVLTHHINDVGPLLDGFNRARMQAGQTQRQVPIRTTILKQAQPGAKRASKRWQNAAS